MMSHSIKHWHRVIGHNNWHDVAKLQQDVVGMNISGSKKKDELQHLLHREGEAGIHSEDVGHSSENETGYRSHRPARTHSAGFPREFSPCSGLHQHLQPFRGSISNEVKG